MTFTNPGVEGANLRRFVSDARGYMSFRPDTVQYKPAAAAKRNDLRAFSLAPRNEVLVLTRCNPDLRNTSVYQVINGYITKAAFG